MPVTAVVGAQWGDEGKGKIVDYLAGNADMVIRFQGGANAGHTVINEMGTFKLHGIPSGIFQPNVINVIGAGTVVAPDQLIGELSEIESRGIDTRNLYISECAHLVMPYHRIWEAVEEASLGSRRIGTTGKAIGPAYADKYGRWGIRVGDLAHPDWLRMRLEQILALKNPVLKLWGHAPMDPADILAQCLVWYEQLKPHIRSIEPLIHEYVRENRSVILEGQLGAGKGVDWGSYPFVTSSSPTAGMAAVGAGIPPHRITEVIGIVKAYSTSVGAGPMVTLDETDIGPRLREIGQEYGATTGRPRKCGWLDAVMLRHSSRINGFTGIAVTRLDILDSISDLRICTAYEWQGRRLEHMPVTPVLEACTPVYEDLPGWRTPVNSARRWSDLPPEAQAYLTRISDITGAPVKFVSVGPRREETIILD